MKSNDFCILTEFPVDHTELSVMLGANSQVPSRANELCHLVISPQMTRCQKIQVKLQTYLKLSYSLISMCSPVWLAMELSRKQVTSLLGTTPAIPTSTGQFTGQLSENKNCEAAGPRDGGSMLLRVTICKKPHRHQCGQHSPVINPRSKLLLCWKS